MAARSCQEFGSNQQPNCTFPFKLSSPINEASNQHVNIDRGTKQKFYAHVEEQHDDVWVSMEH